MIPQLQSSRPTPIFHLHSSSFESTAAMEFLGCLFFFVFGIFFVLYAFGRTITAWAYRQLMKRAFGMDFKGGTASANNKRTASGSSSNGWNQGGDAYNSSANHSGNAHHEGHGRGNSRQRRSGKIFSQDEGTYVDFEDVKD